MSFLRFELASAGYCTAHQHFALSGTPRKTIRFYASFGIIQHPKHGVILFDTGYTERFYEETKRFPAKFYALITPVFIKKEETAVEVLKAKGIAPAKVNYIIISHFHADHVGGLKDFPYAHFVCNKTAWQHWQQHQGTWSVTKGYLGGLVPDNFEKRVTLLDFEQATIQHPQLGRMLDFFQDETIQFCELEGHARGQIGALLQTKSKPVFLMADACWLKDNYLKGHLPNPIVRIFFDSWTAYKESIQRVQAFHKAHPNVLLIPCHCEENIFNYEL